MSSVSELKEEISHLDFDQEEDVEYFTSSLRELVESRPGETELFVRQNIRRFELAPGSQYAYQIVRYVEDEQ